VFLVIGKDRRISLRFVTGPGAGRPQRSYFMIREFLLLFAIKTVLLAFFLCVQLLGTYYRDLAENRDCFLVLDKLFGTNMRDFFKHLDKDLFAFFGCEILLRSYEIIFKLRIFDFFFFTVIGAPLSIC